MSEVWITKDGRRYKYEDMTDQHLMQVITYLEKAIATAYDKYYSSDHVAIDSRKLSADIEKWADTSRAMRQILRRRGVFYHV